MHAFSAVANLLVLCCCGRDAWNELICWLINCWSDWLISYWFLSDWSMMSISCCALWCCTDTVHCADQLWSEHQHCWTSAAKRIHCLFHLWQVLAVLLEIALFLFYTCYCGVISYQINQYWKSSSGDPPEVFVIFGPYMIDQYQTR